MIPTKIQLRADTSTNWAAANPTLELGEVGLETNTGKIKVGDGTSLWIALGYFLEKGPFTLKSYTVATLPAAASYTASMIYVSDETGGAVPAFSDGTNWRRVTDRAIVS